MPTRRDPADLRRALREIAARQGGFFTAAQAVEAGYAHSAHSYHTTRGEWVRVDRGIYRLAGWPLPEHPDLVRWTLWSGGDGVVSHVSALAVHDLGDFMPRRVHLPLPRPVRTERDGVVVHVGSLDGREIEGREGYRVTTPHRALLDAAAQPVELDQLAEAIDEAGERGLTDPSSLRRDADAFGTEAALAIERALAAVGR